MDFEYYFHYFTITFGENLILLYVIRGDINLSLHFLSIRRFSLNVYCYSVTAESVTLTKRMESQRKKYQS